MGARGEGAPESAANKGLADGMSVATDDGLWAVTCYYNPLGYERRLPNYRVFREQLGIPLLTVEAVYDETALTEADAEILVRRECRDILWQKERLLNIAIAELPGDCERVAVLDADVVFTNPDWVERLQRALDEWPVCQAFSRSHHLPQNRELPSPLRGDGPQGRSLAAMVADGTRMQELFGPRLNLWDRGCSPGLAWAGRRSLLQEHGLYEACILGGAYAVIACAALGEFELAENYCEMSDAMRAFYRAWAEPFFDDVQGRLGYADNTVLHLWHGDLPRRFYRERHVGLESFGFDPLTDLGTSDSGCLEWASEKPEMHAYVRRYFAARREDG